MSNLESKAGNASQPTTVASLRAAVTSESVPLAKRFRALFSLKHIAAQGQSSDSEAAIEAIAAAFTTPSALLKHELAYCLGQTKNASAIPHLRGRLEDYSEDPMVRHESAEALGALGDSGSLDIMMKMKDDPQEATVVRETCEIAIDRIKWETSTSKQTEKLKPSDFASIDPAPPAVGASDIPTLKATLLDASKPLFERYRAMFALRDLASPPNAPTAEPAVHALAAGFNDKSALFRHEIAFVFGQLSHPASIPALHHVLGDQKEESMVRHEAAEALGSLGEEPGVEEILKQFLDDAEQVVRDSVIVALDMAEYERTGEMEYAMIPPSANTVTASA